MAFLEHSLGQVSLMAQIICRSERNIRKISCPRLRWNIPLGAEWPGQEPRKGTLAYRLGTIGIYWEVLEKGSGTLRT